MRKYYSDKYKRVPKIPKYLTGEAKTLFKIYSENLLKKDELTAEKLASLSHLAFIEDKIGKLQRQIDTDEDTQFDENILQYKVMSELVKRSTEIKKDIGIYRDTKERDFNFNI